MGPLLIAAALAAAAAAGEAGLGEAQLERPSTASRGWNDLNKDVLLAFAQGDLAAATSLAQRALEAAEQEFGPEHPNTIFSVTNLGLFYRVGGRFSEAEPLYARAAELKEKVLGAGHPETLQALNGLAMIYEAQGRYAEAEVLHRRAFDGRRRFLGPDDPQTLQSMNNLADVLRAQTRYTEAEALYVEAIARAEAVHGRSHEDVLVFLSNLAGLRVAQGRWTDAEPLYKQVIAAREATMGKDHSDTLRTVSNLAALYIRQEKHAYAAPLLRRALHGFAQAEGSDAAEALVVANNLASSYQAIGRYAEAEPLFLRVIAGRSSRLGPEHPDTLRAMGNLAGLYKVQGRLEDAEPLLARVLEARERVLGENHAETISALNDLAVVYDLQGRAAEALKKYERALALQRRVLGTDHPDSLAIMDNLADLKGSQGEKAAAVALFADVLGRRKRILGKRHPDTLRSMNNLAFLYARTGDEEKAGKLYAAALKAARTALGQDHPDTIAIAGNLARLRLRSEHGNLALSPARLATASLRQRQSIDPADLFADAQQRRDELQRAHYFLLLADALWAAERKKPRVPYAADAFEALQDSMAGTTNRAVLEMAARRMGHSSGLEELASRRAELADRWGQLQRAQGEAFASLHAEQVAGRHALQTELNEVQQQIAQLDQRLKSEYPSYFGLIQPKAVPLNTAREMLKPDEAILMVVPTQFGTHLMALTRDDVVWKRSDAKAGDINRLVRRLLWDVGAGVDISLAEAQQWEQLAGSGYPYDRRTAFQLYRAIVAPVATALAGKRHVFIAAGGSLSSLPFGILVTDEPQGSDADPQQLRATKWFADAHALIQIPSVQSLQFLRMLNEKEQSTGTGTFIGFGDPVLQGQAARRGGTRGGNHPPNRGLVALRTAAVDPSQLRAMQRLPGTATELEHLRVALGAPADAVLVADKATESTIRRVDLSSAGIIALATHGLLAGEIDGVAEPGLVFTPPDEPSAADDGLLTTSEIASLRLNADWVILSACNTAAGDGSTGAPGLSGLVRAFFYAGARNLLASHWPVRDDIAARLSSRTVELEKADATLSRAEALQVAMREIRNDPANDTSEDTWAHPNAWAPFAFIGDPGGK
jgi:CHAT domain-containing protein/tetratricopeptide (TPR) repeat protein